MKRRDAAIVKHLIENKNQELNILMISKALKMDYKNVYVIVKRLEKEALLKLESFGQSRRVKLITKMHPLIFEAEYIRKEELLKNKNLAVMLDHFKSHLKSKHYVLLIFGSYAKKKQTKLSDIDLLFIVPEGEEELFEQKVNTAANLLPLPIHHFVFSETQFLNMAGAQKPNVGQEAIKNNIILYGIETYYELTG